MPRIVLLAIALCLSGGRESLAEGELVTGFRIDSMECMEGYKLAFEKIPGRILPNHEMAFLLKCDCECSANENILQVIGVSGNRIERVAEYVGFGIRLMDKDAPKNAVFAIVGHYNTGYGVNMVEDTVFLTGGRLSGALGKSHPPEQISAMDLANLIESSSGTRPQKSTASDKSSKKSKPMHPLLAKVKAARTRDQLRQALLPFTSNPTNLDSLFQKAGTDESGEMEDPAKLKRAESFAVELDTLPGPEYVSQIVFESEPEYQGNFARAYIVSVHRVLSGKPVLAFGTVFDHLYCEMSQRGGMTFTFRDEPAHPKRSRVLFNHNLIKSCGLVLAGARRTDTLRWDGPSFSYIRGPLRDESMTDRSNPEAYGE